ncbi:16S rRNA (cytosine(967)-C(5))-methyltransferase RsmB [Crassaminicella profunda]|uniref:16S rRNA (cytosine(967)-C(5))-methyltransferase RsmB n=1 Tax=Crassaminicella profunda TaxID=1286698 RepID=UPI001CA72292|nr:16S rRNA (cytosine(967)-C(5))-methyltransferase RsmB [Crassaminicella profunda]QZY57121.1 16S rRNA (cytosine(967)-C(5))-methyltransferase RsmB [Crassaminicella profunda]
MKNNARKYVLDILVDIEKNNAFSNIAINRALKGKDIPNLDRRFISELVYGVLENKIYLDFIIGTFSKMKMKKINVKVLNILRMGLYQIIYLDKIPEFAAVDESVKLVKKVDYRSSGFVNGILRSFLRNKKDIKVPTMKEDKIKHLSITYSHPEWLVEKWMKEFGQDFTINLLKANNETPKLSVRTNTLKVTKEELIESFIKEDVKVFPDTFVKEAIHISHLGNIENMEIYQKGFFQIQDESSMLVAHVLAPKPGEFVIDVCAAPGGKTTHIAQLMKNNGKILARDIYNHKLKLINDNAKRLGIGMIKTEVFDAKELDESLLGKADKVLVDAPCSGLGIIRRKPELKYNKKPQDIEEISKLQLEILKNASKYVKKDGVLVYSTCTIEKEENMDIIKKFIKEHNDFEMVDVNDTLPSNLKSEEKFLQLYPNTYKTDGFFICKLRRNNG